MMSDLKNCTDSRLKDFLDPLMPEQEPTFHKYITRKLKVSLHLIDKRHDHQEHDRDVDTDTNKDNRLRGRCTLRKTGTEMLIQDHQTSSSSPSSANHISSTSSPVFQQNLKITDDEK